MVWVFSQTSENIIYMTYNKNKIANIITEYQMVQITWEHKQWTYDGPIPNLNLTVFIDRWFQEIFADKFHRMIKISVCIVCTYVLKYILIEKNVLD